MTHDTMLQKLGSQDFWRRNFVWAVVCVACLSYVTFFPGMTSYDSYTQALESLNGDYRGWHPPIMSFVWRIFIKTLWSDYSVMLAFHLILFWGALYVLGTTIIDRSVRKAYMLFSVLLLPPVLSMTSVIWKDTGMVGCWLLACAILLRSNRLGRKLRVSEAVMVALLLFYGLAVRYNSLFALPPLCYWFAASYTGLRGKRVLNGVLALVMTAALMMANNVTMRLLVANTNLYSELKTNREMLNLRLIGGHMGKELNPGMISVDALNPAFINRITQRPAEYFAHRWESYKQQNGIGSYAPSYPYEWAKIKGNRQLQSLARTYLNEYACAPKDPDISIHDAFVNMYLDYPVSSISYHWERYRQLLRINEAESCYPYEWNVMTENEPLLRSLIYEYFDATRNFVWFKGWFWVMATFIALAIVAKRIKKHEMESIQAGCLCVSSLCYSLAYFVLTPQCDFRYFYWSMVALLLACFVEIDAIEAWCKRSVVKAHVLGSRLSKRMQEFGAFGD